MTIIFVLHTEENTDCAEQLRKGLEAQGYAVWREPGYLDRNSVSYPRLIENAILGCVAVVLVWSNGAAQSEWIDRHRLFAQRLKKPIFPVVLDGTDLPNTLIVDNAITGQILCTNVVALLIAQPTFPRAGDTDSLSVLSEKAAHEFIRCRKEAIKQAADMLKRGEHREAVLEVLEYLARNELIMTVRSEAQKILDATKNKVTAPLSESRYCFFVRCEKGHVSRFDKRIVCGAYKEGKRTLKISAGKEFDELYLTCDACGCCVVVRVDCEGYK